MRKSAAFQQYICTDGKGGPDVMATLGTAIASTTGAQCSGFASSDGPQ